jgi:hypothetical protein
MSHKSSEAMFLRFPADLRLWVAEEALHGRRSMNAVIVDAVEQLKATRAERLAEDSHAAAIELTISAARLPKGTAIMLQTEHDHLGTDILARRPSQADYSVLARVNGEEVVFADDFVTPIAESEA